MLGYNAGQFTKTSQFGRVSDDFGMDNVKCIGTEASILDCPHTTEEDCGGDEGLGVICSGIKSNLTIIYRVSRIDLPAGSISQVF